MNETFGLKSSLVFRQTLVLNNLSIDINRASNNKMCWVSGTIIGHLLHTRTKISMKTELFGVNHQIGQPARSIKQQYCWLFFITLGNMWIELWNKKIPNVRHAKSQNLSPCRAKLFPRYPRITQDILLNYLISINTSVFKQCSFNNEKNPKISSLKRLL